MTPPPAQIWAVTLDLGCHIATFFSVSCIGLPILLNDTQTSGRVWTLK